MTRKVPTIPPVGADLGPAVRALAGVVSFITAQQQPVVAPLPTTGATTDQIAAKVNEVIARLQGQ
jgi:hypothetical protein